MDPKLNHHPGDSLTIAMRNATEKVRADMVQIVRKSPAIFDRFRGFEQQLRSAKLDLSYALDVKDNEIDTATATSASFTSTNLHPYSYVNATFRWTKRTAQFDAVDLNVNLGMTHTLYLTLRRESEDFWLVGASLDGWTGSRYFHRTLGSMELVPLSFKARRRDLVPRAWAKGEAWTSTSRFGQVWWSPPAEGEGIEVLPFINGSPYQCAKLASGGIKAMLERPAFTQPTPKILEAAISLGIVPRIDEYGHVQYTR